MVVTPGAIGTPLAGSNEPIGADNFTRLANVAQWGKGSILGAAFAPDGKSFVVGSAFGFAVYDVGAPDTPPRWVAFDKPFIYKSLTISGDGLYIRLNDEGNLQIRKYSDGQKVENLANIQWVETTFFDNDTGEGIKSPDGLKFFKSYMTNDEDNWNIGYSIREVYDSQTGTLLYQLPDETFYVEYGDYNQPEGCDLYSFSMCGNVYDPIPMVPHRVAFSSSGDSLAVMYRPIWLGRSRFFSTLRIYNGNNGALMNKIGNFDQPVETFAYSPDGNMLLVAYVDGSINLLDVREQTVTFTAWHFSAPLVDLAYSASGEHLLIQRWGDTLEIRSTRDGALLGRHEAVAFAVSPVAEQVAIADRAGNIDIKDMGSGQTIEHIQAHTDKIYGLTYSPNGALLVSSAQDCSMKLWDVTTGNYLHPFEETIVNAYGEPYTDSRIFVYYMRFVPGADQLIGFGSWGTAVSWNINSGARNYVVESAPLDYYQGMITLNPHFPEFFGVDLASNQFFINSLGYDLQTGQVTGEYQAPKNLDANCASSGPLSKDGRLRFSLGYDNLDGRICLLDAADWHLMGTIEVIPEEVSKSIYLSWPYLSPDGRQLILTTNLGMIYVYEIMP